MARGTRGKPNSATSNVHEANSNTEAAAKQRQKRSRSENVENVSGSRQMPKRAAACSDFNEKSICFSEQSSFVKTEVEVKHESEALVSTSGQHDSPPNRRLKDFTFHNAYGIPRGIDMLEFEDLFISGLILPLEECCLKEKEMGFRCKGFGRVESWAISGFEEGLPVIWVSTKLADYDCVKPSNQYRKQYNLFFEKARACVETYKKLSRSSGGNAHLTLDELITGVVTSISSSNNFPHGIYIREFFISQGEFIYNQLIGLDATSKANDQTFADLPVLLALKDEKKKYESVVTPKATASGKVTSASVKIGGELTNQSTSIICMGEEVEDMKFARLLLEEENWLSMNQKDHRLAVSSSNFIKINDDEIAEFPANNVRKCSSVTALPAKMQQRRHTILQVYKKGISKKKLNLNPRKAVATTVSTRMAIPATTTRLINKIWGEYFSNYLPEDPREAGSPNKKEDDGVDEKKGESREEHFNEVEDQKGEKSESDLKLTKLQFLSQDIRWDGESLGKTCTGRALYKQAIFHGHMVAVGDFVVVETANSDPCLSIYFVEYMFENSDARKMVHGRLLVQGFQTVLGNAANEWEVFLTNDCLEFELGDVKRTVDVEIRLTPWGYQHWKANINKDKIDKEKAEERKLKGLPTNYYCKSLYWPERGAFFRLPKDTMGLGSGLCHSCRMKESQKEKKSFKLNFPSNGFTYKGAEYCMHDFVYLAPHHFLVDGMDHKTFKSRRNVGLRPYAISQLLEIELCKASERDRPESAMVKMRRFFRPEDISVEKAYYSDIREVYYSEQIVTVPIVAIQGKCEVRKKQDLPFFDSPAIFEHIFFCEHLYDPESGFIKQLPAHVKLSSSKERMVDDAAYRMKKGKCKEGENDFDDIGKKSEALFKNRLATLDIFAGCGGLSEGLEKAGASLTKWAIEYEELAGKAFKLNHPEATVFINNCNVILRAIMTACGDEDECISTSEATELAEKLDDKEINNLPRPGEVEFINGGPPCQGFSGMNRYNQGTWSQVQCEMILAFLSFADYFRPKFFLLENVRNFVSFNKGQTFRLTLASLLEMGYQVRFGILQAGAYGVSQSRKRAFIWAASPEETLPEWPEPMHVFAGPELKVKLSQKSQYTAVRSTANGAPFRAITVKDTIGDLPAVLNGASATTMEYENEPVSWFQKTIRGDMTVLTDHISKKMNELNHIRCKRIPKGSNADWRDLPNEKVQLSKGQEVDLVPCCLPNTAKRNNHWKGLYGRLDWNGNFLTCVTDPQPMGKVGKCFHPEQDRIITVRECARSQGFSDSYKFAGNIHHKHRQIGNAVPPPLAFALGRKLKEAIEMKSSR